MSEWHKTWQERFPEYQQEVVFKKDDMIFRADIFRKEKREVIEFQHSRITSEDFHDRNNFYIWCSFYHISSNSIKFIIKDQ
jgi:hypothetical protein